VGICVLFAKSKICFLTKHQIEYSSLEKKKFLKLFLTSFKEEKKLVFISPKS